jgi:hypothetical protein
MDIYVIYLRVITDLSHKIQYFPTYACDTIKRILDGRSRIDTLLTYLLMELSPSSGAANCAATEELPSILRNPKVQCSVHKNPPLVSILIHINPIHIMLSYLFKVHFNIVHPPTSWSTQWCLSLYLSHKYPMCIRLLR